MDLAPFPKKHLMELISFNFFYIYCGRNGNAERREISQEDFRIDLLLISSDARDWIMPQIEFFSAWNFFLEIYGAWKCRRRRRRKKIHQMKREIFMCGRFFSLFPPPPSSCTFFSVRQANICPRRKPPKNAAATFSYFSFKRKKGGDVVTLSRKKCILKKSFAKWSRCCIEMSGRKFNLACQRLAAKKKLGGGAKLAPFCAKNSRASVGGTQDVLLRLNCIHMYIHMYGKGRKLRKKEKIKLMEANEAKGSKILLVAQLFFVQFSIFDGWEAEVSAEYLLPFSSELAMMPTRSSFSWRIHWVHHSSVFLSLPGGDFLNGQKRDVFAISFPLCAAFSLL